MKKQEILSKIKSEALNEMPDVFDKINLNEIEIVEPYEKIRNPFNLRRAFTYTFSSLVILISGFMFYNFAYIPSISNTIPLESETEIFAFQTVSSAALLSSYQVSDLEYDNDIFTPIELSQTNINIGDEVDIIGSYLNLAETMVSNENNYVYNVIESDKAEFEYAFEYRSVDLAGNLITYKGYYNVLRDSDNNQLSNGILIHDDKTYQITCSSIQNGEVSINKYRIRINNRNYVEVIDSSNGEVQRFSYTVYRNGEVDNSSVITLSSRNNNIKAVMEIQGQNNQNLTLEFNRDMSNELAQQLRVKYIYKKNNQMDSGEFNVSLVENTETGLYNFQFKLGNTVITTERPIKGNQKANDDDFINNHGPGNQTTDITTTDDSNGNGPGGNTNNPGNNSNTSPGSQKNRNITLKTDNQLYI